MAIPRIGGPGIGLGAGQGISFSSQGAPQGITNAVTLAAGEVFIIPAGTYFVYPGPYTFLQWLDPVSNIWKTMNTAATVNPQIDSDGTNFRLANTTGCVIGAFITTGGAGGPNGIGQTATSLTITCSGSPTFVPIVGGALSTSGAPVVTTGGQGSGFTFPPIVVIDAPPVGGIQATATIVLSGGGLPSTGAAFTYTNQGAGYTSVPNITIIPDARDLNPVTGLFSGTLPVVTGGALTGSGVLTGLLVTNHGASFTASGAVPAITIVTGGAGWTTLPTASGIMNWSITTPTSAVFGTIVVASGSTSPIAFTTTNDVVPGAGSAVNQGSLVVGNPAYESQLTFVRRPWVSFALSGGSLSTGANAAVLEDAGVGIQRVPSIVLLVTTCGGAALSTTLSGVLGGSPADTTYLQRV